MLSKINWIIDIKNKFNYNLFKQERKLHKKKGLHNGKKQKESFEKRK